MRWSLLVVLFVGCGDNDRTVPFRVHEDTEDEVVDTPASPAPAEDAVSRSIEGESTVDVDGAELDVSPRKLHAVLQLDTDSDGDRDAIGLTVTRAEDGRAEVGLVLARRDAQAMSTRSIGRSLVDACDEPEIRAEIQRQSGHFMIGKAELSCEESSSTVFILASDEASPRLRERFVATDLTMTARFADLDADDHQDVEITLGAADRTTTLAFYNRPGGLGSDATAFGASLDALLTAIGEDDDSARELFDALCGPSARFGVGGRMGLECPQEQTERADTLRLTSLAVEDLAHAALRVPNSASAAFLSAARHQSPEWRRITRSPPTDDSFSLRGGRLVLAGGRVAFDLESGEQIPLESPGAPPVTSPDGQVAARLSGERIELVDAGSAVLAGGAPISRQRLGDAPSGLRWWLLGWAPQGLFVFDGDSRFVVPRTESGALLAPIEVADDSPSPAPLTGARVSADGERWIVELPLGVLAYTAAGVELFHPVGWDDVSGDPSSAAMSEDGAWIAVAKGDGVFAFRTGRAPSPRPTSTP